ncbi:MAG TPA: zf-HC2 domain-containing protein [candidate division Zixibacteria bacterium]|nr:zf-HC2 domain-containing protein [candidate division Zixibacteria bacterium]
MQCREARARIKQLSNGSLDPVADADLKRHLNECPDCARFCESTVLMSRVLESVRREQTGDMMPLSERRRRVMERIRTHRWPNSQRHWSWTGQSVVAAVTTAVVLLLLLVPFNYYRIVSYNLSLAGVSQDLAENESFCDLLYNLGLHDANVDVLGCDSTCKVLVLDLKTREEAHLVYSAIQQIDDDDLMAQIVPVKSPASSSLLERANETLRVALN